MCGANDPNDGCLSNFQTNDDFKPSSKTKEREKEWKWKIDFAVFAKKVLTKKDYVATRWLIYVILCKIIDVYC